MNDEFFITFEGDIEKREFHPFTSYVVYLPLKFHEKLPLKQNPRLRVHGFIDQTPFELALQPTGKNRWYLMLSKRLLKLLKKSVGESIIVMFDIADQEHVNIPLELANALNADATAQRKWQSLTPGRRRGMAYRVESAKRMETKQRRVFEILDELANEDSQA